MREEKQRRSAGEGSTKVAQSDEASHAVQTVEVHDMSDLLYVRVLMNTNNEDTDPSFDLDASRKSDSDHMIESL